MQLTLETTMMSGIQLILNALLLKETVRRNTGNIIYTAKGLTNHMDERLFYISKSYMSDQMIVIFPAPNGRVDDYTDRPHNSIYQT